MDRQFVATIPRIHAGLTRALIETLATAWAASPAWRRLARVYMPPGPELGRRIHAAVRDEITYQREPMEWVQSPGVTLQWQAADCDCKTVLAAALAGAHGMRWRVVMLAREGGELVRVMPDEPVGRRTPFHVWPQLWDGGRWVDCETCHPPEKGHLTPIAYGERPEAVIARFGADL